jgi:molybdopterin biosynthesis enzyme
MVEANCLIDIPDEKARINMGDVVMIQPFADLI